MSKKLNTLTEVTNSVIGALRDLGLPLVSSVTQDPKNSNIFIVKLNESLDISSQNLIINRIKQENQGNIIVKILFIING